MRHFLVEARTHHGDSTFIAESQKNEDLTLDIFDGWETTEQEQSILDRLDIEYNPEDLIDQVKITELNKIERVTI